MSRGGKNPSQRQLRVGEEIRHALARILRSDRIHDPDLAGVSVTVTEVRASPDLKAATVYVTPFGGGEAKTVVSALQRAAGFLQRELAGEVALRVLPRLSFAHDTRFERAHAIERVLADPKVARDLNAEKKPEGEDGA